MSGPLLQEVNGRQRVGAGIKSCVNHCVEIARAKRLLKVFLFAPVPIETLYSGRQRAARDPAIEDRDGMPALLQQLNDGQPQVARSADDQDLNSGFLSTNGLGLYYYRSSWRQK